MPKWRHTPKKGNKRVYIPIHIAAMNVANAYLHKVLLYPISLSSQKERSRMVRLLMRYEKREKIHCKIAKRVNALNVEEDDWIDVEWLEEGITVRMKEYLKYLKKYGNKRLTGKSLFAIRDLSRLSNTVSKEIFYV